MRYGPKVERKWSWIVSRPHIGGSSTCLALWLLDRLRLVFLQVSFFKSSSNLLTALVLDKYCKGMDFRWRFPNSRNDFLFISIKKYPWSNHRLSFNFGPIVSKYLPASLDCKNWTFKVHEEHDPRCELKTTHVRRLIFPDVSISIICDFQHINLGPLVLPHFQGRIFNLWGLTFNVFGGTFERSFEITDVLYHAHFWYVDQNLS